MRLLLVTLLLLTLLLLLTPLLLVTLLLVALGLLITLLRLVQDIKRTDARLLKHIISLLPTLQACLLQHTLIKGMQASSPSTDQMHPRPWHIT
jgi:hypothetical protein